MDWRFNTIWFERLEQHKIFQQDFKENAIATENKDFKNAEYAIIWHLKEKLKSFDNLSENENLSYLELNWANHHKINPKSIRKSEIEQIGNLKSIKKPCQSEDRQGNDCYQWFH